MLHNGDYFASIKSNKALRRVPAGRRLVLARSTIIILLLLPPVVARGRVLFRLPRTCRLVMKHRWALLTNTMRLIAGNAVARCKLYFQLDNFIPLLIRSIALGDRKKFTQTATIVVGRRGRRQDSATTGGLSGVVSELRSSQLKKRSVKASLH
ncbi:MAG: hypothetical protein IPP59_03450 [Betaproteobacteria bacterium]|nr:hypothetical protein [Candidatus Dechloromonas phosphorivorans]